MMQMGYRVVQAAESAVAIAEWVSLLGDAASNAWLDDETRVDGMQLRQDVSAADAAALVVEWPHGRLFNQGAEIRWQHLPGGALHLVVLTEAFLPPCTEGAIALEPVDDAPYHLILWGSVGPDGWQEERVPGIAKARCYPKTWTGPYAALAARDYVEQEPGEAEQTPRDGERDPPDVERTVVRYLAFDGRFNPSQVGAGADVTT